MARPQLQIDEDQLEKLAAIGKEIKPHPKFPSYGANALGDIFNIKFGRKLNPGPTSRGYLHLKISEGGKTKTYLAHRMVAECFLGPLLPSQTVDHLDFNKINNPIENIRIVTAGENHKSAILAGKIKKGLSHYKTRVSLKEIGAMRDMAANGFPQTEIGKKYGLSQPAISRIIRRDYGQTSSPIG